MSDVEKARTECERMMKKIDLIESGEVRGVFELHIQHIHAALDGNKEDLYND
jgi:hypothetical protein